MNNELIIGALYEFVEPTYVKKYSIDWDTLRTNKRFKLNQQNIMLHVKTCPFRGWPLFLYKNDVIILSIGLDEININNILKRVSI